MAETKGGSKIKVGTFAWLLALSVGVASCAPGTPDPTPTGTLAPPTMEATRTPEPPAATQPAEATFTPRPPEVTPTQEPAASPTTAGATSTPAATASLTDYQWKRAGLAGTAITDLDIEAQGTNFVVAAGPGGVWHSSYDYTKWSQYNVSLSSQGRMSEVSAGSRNVIYVTNHTGCASGEPATRLRSLDGGNTWQPIQNEIMRVAASGPLIAYAATCAGVEKTTDSGATWSALLGSAVTNFDVYAIAASPDGETVYASYASEGGSGRIMMSLDAGATWKDVTPKNAPDNDFRAATNLFFVPGSVGRPDDGGLYMATEQGLWFLPLESTEWRLTQEQTQEDRQPGRSYYVTALYVDTSYSEEYDKPGPVIYTARIAQGAESEAGLGVFRSTDGGATWQSVGSGLPTTTVNSLALAPLDLGASANRADTLIAATNDGIWTLPMPPPFR